MKPRIRATLCWSVAAFGMAQLSASTISSPYGTSYQVNVNAIGQNIAGDAANEPSFCIDPTNPNRMAVGWRQFNSVASDFRQAGWAYSTNGGLNWTFPGVLTPGVFRSDPVLDTDAEGRFYYLSLQTSPNYHCDLWRSTNGGASWQNLGNAVGGDKAWMNIDKTSSPGRGNIYQCWSTAGNSYSNRIFSRTINGGTSWESPLPLPQTPYWATLETGPNGELYLFGWNGGGFWLNRSTDATNASAPPTFDLTTPVNLGGSIVLGSNPVNPAGLLGQPWIAVDRSSGPTRGNVYALCSVTGTGNPFNVMFARSTDGGSTWSAPVRINDDATNQGAYHWFGTMSVAPNGRIDACWNDTRHNPTNGFSGLYYSWSDDGGLTWAVNRPVSPAFNHSLGYPVQQKMGDYIGMVSLNECACIVYTATHNGEEDLFFVRAELPIVATITRVGNAARVSWNSVPGGSYCVQVKESLSLPWSGATNVACVVSTGYTATVDDLNANSSTERFYRVVRQP